MHLQNDLLQWFMDEASMRNTSDEAIPPRLFLINFASIHTSSLVGLVVTLRSTLLTGSCRAW